MSVLGHKNNAHNTKGKVFMRKVALGFLLGINLLYMGEICAKETASAGPGGLSITAFDRLAKTTVFGGYFDTEWKSS